MDITFIDETNQFSENYFTKIKELLQFSADFLKLPDTTEMSVTFTTNEKIQQINQKFRGKNVPTDVISFALEDEGEDEFPIILDEMLTSLPPKNLGDIIISIEKAEEQAQDYGHSFERELGFLAVHGFLHLNGYDHMNEEDEKEMFDLQRKILDDYGLKR
ncbi:rRNA maturation RNase YbeY [Melissococcus plutonius]|uniref:Endoribonuclease YbeY n=2 Tax=Melissococcus plutonius TaxID=33970 RepID=F3YB03_MELPT|nr:rRNA maturation RNase YbeY [Melissococcus plutonius]BAL61971.1 metal-dependent hydrolase [Melissococcus plutonius DAT561]AIM25115.1 endoribonuclease YbeY [Melissococcus plutonius S1]KMT25359.1 endoribonuclease YbeY [Melissococcus plutonius]KMT25628.1 endoribonuclease YbeY [Melissococcus plutonius]KMT26263.1 endoribonuclease YbeY [Melissococcus plutonius]